MNLTAPNPRRTWLILCAAFTLAPVIYGIVLAQTAGRVAAPPDPGALRSVFRVFAPVLLAAGAFLLTRAPRARSDGPALAAFLGGEKPAEPAAFQSAFIVGVALAETSSVLGFVLVMIGAPLTEYLPFAAGTLVVLLAIAWPTGLRYWSGREAAEAAGGEPPPIG